MTMSLERFVRGGVQSFYVLQAQKVFVFSVESLAKKVLQLICGVSRNTFSVKVTQVPFGALKNIPAASGAFLCTAAYALWINHLPLERTRLHHWEAISLILALKSLAILMGQADNPLFGTPALSLAGAFCADLLPVIFPNLPSARP